MYLPFFGKYGIYMVRRQQTILVSGFLNLIDTGHYNTRVLLILLGPDLSTVLQEKSKLQNYLKLLFF